MPDIAALIGSALFLGGVRGYDATRRRIVIVPPNEKEPAPLEEFAEYAKAVFMGLMLLRYLSSSLKCEPTPLLVKIGRAHV